MVRSILKSIKSRFKIIQIDKENNKTELIYWIGYFIMYERGKIMYFLSLFLIIIVIFNAEMFLILDTTCFYPLFILELFLLLIENSDLTPLEDSTIVGCLISDLHLFSHLPSNNYLRFIDCLILVLLNYPGLMSVFSLFWLICSS